MSAYSEEHFEAVARMTASDVPSCKSAPSGGRPMVVTKIASGIASGAYRVAACGETIYVRCNLRGATTHSIEKSTCCHRVADEQAATDPPLISFQPDDECMMFAGD